jgi:N-acetyl-gamma-glutamyl-phosphate reductase
VIKVGILGITGAFGGELSRYLIHHPEFRLTEVSGRSEAGKKLADVFPYLSEYDLTIAPEIGDADLYFSALPHKSSAELCAPLVNAGKKVVDCSADFRLHDLATYEETYEVKHPNPELLPQAVYGLTELHKAEVAASRLIGNPGCYPTAAILALAPAFCSGIAHPNVVVDAKSGVSGAGRTPSQRTNYIEINENTVPYSYEGHRHEPEMTQELNALRPRDAEQVRTTFVAQLVPMTRGILACCYTQAVRSTSTKQLRDLYRDFYAEHPFVRIVERPPETKWTYGNNMVFINPYFHEKSGNLVLMAVEDNLGKGAAGQAIQNANLMCGLPETCGLDIGAVYP